MKLSLVIPFYNEEVCAAPVLEDLVAVFSRKKIDYEIIAVDNGSHDRTRKILQRLAARHRQIKVISVMPNRDFGGGIIEGFRHAKGDIIGFSCGDGEISAADSYKVYAALAQGGADLCKPVRVSRTDGFFRRFFSAAYNLFVLLLFQVRVRDVNAYPLLMKRYAYERISPNIPNWLFNLDILYKAKLQGFTLSEIKVQHQRRAGGKSHIRLSKVMHMCFDMLRYWWNSPRR
ncbi:glycosyltransferase family 2 protein [Candidatus Woesearchaeota archaeon]|nr:glycosyltransferase family 2 protein [Candidatus Woesearchaeota archaeon]